MDISSLVDQMCHGWIDDSGSLMSALPWPGIYAVIYRCIVTCYKDMGLETKKLGLSAWLT